ncbi:DUF5134 domain-containing protein [Streptacidiphilus carbonis]|uniref:DUF5134 domain-containing protein n=1 Tax=Streptacidiphilus carbonis TaxID=105422 RepID=UPI000A010C7F
MQPPAPVAWLMVALMAATGLYCLARCRHAPRLSSEERRLDASAGLKGMAMAVMVFPLGVGPAVPEVLWLLVFLPAGLWSLGAALRGSIHRRHHLDHAVGHLAMAYMAVAMAGPMPRAGSMPGMATMRTPAGLPWLTGALLVFFAASAVVSGTRLLGAGAPLAAGARAPLPEPLWAPQLPEACHIVLGLPRRLRLLHRRAAPRRAVLGTARPATPGPPVVTDRLRIPAPGAGGHR